MNIRVTEIGSVKSVTRTFDLFAEYGEAFEDWGMSDAQIRDFVRPIEVSHTDLANLNGNHCLFGYVEALLQSGEAPSFLRVEGPISWRWEPVAD